MWWVFLGSFLGAFAAQMVFFVWLVRYAASHPLDDGKYGGDYG